MTITSTVHRPPCIRTVFARLRRLAFAGLAGLAAAGATLSPTLADERGQIEPRTIDRAIVPTNVERGDRDFDGKGPIITVGTRLFVGRNGRAVFAEVIMSAREDGGDGSRTSIGPLTFEVWRWQPTDGARFVREITSPTISTVRFRSGPGCAPIGCALIGAAEDGGLIVTVNGNGPVRDIRLLGDTLGDDISTDNNPHGDTSIRRIRFNPVNVIFTDSLVRS